ncbi:MAG: hypothetical protein ACI93T_004826 [Porticoccaceae bacterium]|jgi:hypothetical protein
MNPEKSTVMTSLESRIKIVLVFIPLCGGCAKTPQDVGPNQKTKPLRLILRTWSPTNRQRLMF